MAVPTKDVYIVINGRALTPSSEKTNPVFVSSTELVANKSLHWVFIQDQQPGVYAIKHVESGLVLDVTGAEDAEHTPLCVYPSKYNSPNQQFTLEGDRIVTKLASHRVITLNKENKVELQTVRPSATTSQGVKFYEADSFGKKVEVKYPIDLNIIHFNDVYDIKERVEEPVGGANRFSAAVKSFSKLNPMVLFSGDLFNPSVMSSVTKGKHMIPVMHELNVACAAIGNHEFDYGPDTLAKYVAECKFPWLLSNVVDKNTGLPLVGSIKKTIISWNGVRVGLVGLAELDWLESVGGIFAYAAYQDYVVVGKQLISELKAEGVDIIVALTHMRVEAAKDTSRRVPGIDLVLNGHDHFYEDDIENGIHILTSGVDFKQLSVINCQKKDKDSPFQVTVKRVDITKQFPEDPAMKAITGGFIEQVNKKMNKVIGATGTQLDCTTDGVRKMESNMGNLLTDIMRTEFQTHVAFFNGGSIRSDSTYGPGDFTVRDLMSILPFTNMAITIRLSGAKLLEVLEVGVGKWPDQVGRFTQVSGIKFVWDSNKPCGSRVKSVLVNGAPLEPKRIYTAATSLFIAQGNDGYECLGNGGCELVTNEETGIDLTTLVRKYFIRMRALGLLKTESDTVKRAVIKWKSLCKSLRKPAPYTVSPVNEGRITRVEG